MQRSSMLFILSIWALLIVPSTSETLDSRPKHDSYMRREAVLAGNGEVLGTNHHKSAPAAHLHHGSEKVHHQQHAHIKKKQGKKVKGQKKKKAAGVHKEMPEPEAAKPAAAAPAAAEKPAGEAKPAEAATGAEAAAAANASAAVAEGKPVSEPGPKDTKTMDIKIPADSKFYEAFTITFKVKFKSFARNVQRIVTVDNHGMEIEALGPRFGKDAGKLAASFFTESGLGPNNRGVEGSDGHGQLLSETLKPNVWYLVKYQKTNTNALGRGGEVSLTIDAGKPVTSKSDDKIIFTPGDFDLKKEPLPTKLLAGKKVCDDDQSLDGEIGDVAFTTP